MFSISVATGGFLGFVYDVFRFARVLFSTDRPKMGSKRGRVIRSVSALVIFFEDLVFSLICGVALLLLTYYTNDGQLRGLALLGVAAGGFVYFNTIGKLTLRLFPWLARETRKITVAVLKLLALPFLLLKAAYLATLGRTIKVLRARLAQIKDEKYTAKVISDYRLRATDGFGLADLYKSTEAKEAEGEVELGQKAL